MNLVVAVSLYGVFRGLRHRKQDSDDIERIPEVGGLLSRYFARLFQVISEPWKSYFVGVLFGVGFDTASEIALIAISVGVGVSGTVPIWMVLLLPFMFTCGMVLVDTADGVAMRLAYGWAMITPLRKIYYNLTITVISVLVALAIGTVELLQVASLELKPQGVIWGFLGGIDFETLGFVVVGVFATTWLVSLVNWRLRNYDNPRLVLATD
jgi:high-affinity nickel-transport protein